MVAIVATNYTVDGDDNPGDKVGVAVVGPISRDQSSFINQSQFMQILKQIGPR